MSAPRMTLATALILRALSRGNRYGFDVAEATGLRGGTVYPALRRLEERGLVESRWEDVSVGREEGRPTRKYYRLLPAAAPLLQDALRRYPAARLGLIDSSPAVDAEEGVR